QFLGGRVEKVEQWGFGALPLLRLFLLRRDLVCHGSLERRRAAGAIEQDFRSQATGTTMYISRADGAGDTNQRQYLKSCLPIGTGPLRKTEHFGTLRSLEELFE
ncbi:MAG: hypothetical protein WAM99_02825, partial [Xanthobacteraceae bacterium]